MRQKARRVVTGHHPDGRSMVMIDDNGPNMTEIKAWPGLWVTELWTSEEMPIDNKRPDDRGARKMRHDPGPNGTIFRIVEIPPESPDAPIDAKAAFEQLGSENKPKAADSAKHQSMHKTNSVDYLVVISGEMTMLMEDGETVLKQGDCIVQRGTNHAWVNKSGKPCILAAVLVDSVPAP
jgi:mannose-6-phosphate isomerase-like protein (cupin superfamily)